LTDKKEEICAKHKIAFADRTGNLIKETQPSLTYFLTSVSSVSSSVH